jgi:hypothetical protein
MKAMIWVLRTYVSTADLEDFPESSEYVHSTP